MRALRDFQTWLTLLCGVTLALSMAKLHPSLPYLSVAFGSYFALKAAWESLRERSIDVNFLMVFAALGAVVLGHPMEAAVLLFLFSLSSTLESFAMARTRSAIEGLIKLRPEFALVVTPEGDIRTPVSDLTVGTEVRVLPFEHIPTDGVLLTGESTIDEHAMTGESVPVPKQVGDRLLAGTLNLESMITLRVTTAVGDTTLEKIVDLVRDAQENKASGERISQWFGQRYTFLVLAAFGISLGIRLATGQEWSVAAYGALTLLVALSPCALVISTPASTLSALAKAARRGVLIRGGEFIEAVGKVDLIAMDKTGTLTRGLPELVEICVCAATPVGVGAVGEDACWSGGEMSTEAKRLLGLCAAAEQYSTHPIAEAVLRKAGDIGIVVPEAHRATAHSGLGVAAEVGGVMVRVGQRRFFEAEGIPIEADLTQRIESFQHAGMTVAIMEVDGRMAAFGFRDVPRPEAKSVLEKLRALGVKEVSMLTGDTPQTAASIAATVGIQSVHAGLLPADKTELVEAWKNEGRTVMMVGDGINDAPSLAKAAVGVAMGGLGSDVALNAADVVIMQDKLDRIPEVIELGRRTNRIIRANLIFASSVIVVLTVGSFLFDRWFPELRSLMLPFAVLGHEGSTVLVILNGLRLLR